ncbi:hypothetical protein [Mesoflavibacter zeaxanthinifaciens]|uniref:hypothetical protein n=1 Tax=Mesoflavibacter zeaxanthinifaciens TaxID=393060 RepID=UPI003A92553B
MKEIGGYFGLELDRGMEFHKNAMPLNTGRNALEYILRANNYDKIYLPFFICEVVLEPIRKHQLEIEFYSINEQLEPIFDFNVIEDKSAFLYVNYFGLKNLFVQTLCKKCKNLIIDNSQSFFSKPEYKTDTFYSPRKFFGVPDGAYLYCNKKLNITLKIDQSWDRSSHLLKRLDINAEFGFDNFKNNELELVNLDIKQMSNLSKAILSSINYKKAIQRRTENYNFLDAALAKFNNLRLSNDDGIPMVYPFWTNDPNIKEKLRKRQIYTATYWENVKRWCTNESLEYQLTNEVVYLPIDQRYGKTEMENILKYI